MTNPAYDPTSGKPVYDPTTNKPAMDCPQPPSCDPDCHTASSVTMHPVYTYEGCDPAARGYCMLHDYDYYQFAVWSNYGNGYANYSSVSSASVTCNDGVWTVVFSSKYPLMGYPSYDLITCECIGTFIPTCVDGTPTGTIVLDAYGTDTRTPGVRTRCGTFTITLSVTPS